MHVVHLLVRGETKWQAQHWLYMYTYTLYMTSGWFFITKVMKVKSTVTVAVHLYLTLSHRCRSWLLLLPRIPRQE